MGNENKMKKKKDLIPSGSRFLPEEIRDIDSSAKIYSLETEFEKTKKNKNYKLYIILFVFIALVLGLSYMYTSWLEKKNREEITINIEDFDDMRLKEIIDSARNRGGNIDSLKIQLQILEIEVLNKILGVQKNTYQREMEVFASNLSDQDVDRRVSELKEQENQSIKTIRNEYNTQIGDLKKKIAAIEKEKKKAEETLRQKGDYRVSNEDKVYSLKMRLFKEKQNSGIEALRKYYNDLSGFVFSKYNPSIEKSRARDIIYEKTDGSLINSAGIRDYDSSFSEAGYTREQYQKIRKSIADFNVVLRRLMRIPYENSVPVSFKAIDNHAGQIVTVYDSALGSIGEAFKARNEAVTRLTNQIDFLVESNQADGIILDHRDPSSLVIQTRKNISIEDGKTGKVLEGNSEIADIQFFKDQSGNLKAKVTRLESKKKPVNAANFFVLDSNRKKSKGFFDFFSSEPQQQR